MKPTLTDGSECEGCLQAGKWAATIAGLHSINLCSDCLWKWTSDNEMLEIDEAYRRAESYIKKAERHFDIILGIEHNQFFKVRKVLFEKFIDFRQKLKAQKKAMEEKRKTDWSKISE